MSKGISDLLLFPRIPISTPKNLAVFRDPIFVKVIFLSSICLLDRKSLHISLIFFAISTLPITPMTQSSAYLTYHIRQVFLLAPPPEGGEGNGVLIIEGIFFLSGSLPGITLSCLIPGSWFFT